MIKIAGAGPGNPKLLTAEVQELIKDSQRVIAFGRIKDSLKDLREDILEVNRMDELLELIEKSNEDTLVLASGDPNFFGVVELIRRKGIEISSIYPGISSLQYFMSKIQKSYSHVNTFSVHGREFDFSKIDWTKGEYAFLIDKIHNGNYISKSLDKLGITGEIFYGYNLSYDDEYITSSKIGEEIDEPSSLGVVLAVPYVD